MAEEKTSEEAGKGKIPRVHQRVPREAVREAWDRATPERREQAAVGLKARLGFRGISVNNIFIVMALTGAAAVALATLTVTMGFTAKSRLMVLATIPGAIGFGFVLVGIFPVWGLFPGFRKDEALEGLEREPFDWYAELAGRSMKQRFGLWWARVCLALAVAGLVVSLYMFCRAAWTIAFTLPA